MAAPPQIGRMATQLARMSTATQPVPGPEVPQREPMPDPPMPKEPPRRDPPPETPPQKIPPRVPPEPGQPLPVITDPHAPDANPIDPRVF